MKIICSLVQLLETEAARDGTRGDKLDLWKNTEDEAKTERHKAWETFIANNRKRKIYVDREVDISRLCDEMNDMEKEFER